MNLRVFLQGDDLEDLERKEVAKVATESQAQGRHGLVDGGRLVGVEQVDVLAVPRILQSGEQSAGSLECPPRRVLAGEHPREYAVVGELSLELVDRVTGAVLRDRGKSVLQCCPERRRRAVRKRAKLPTRGVGSSGWCPALSPNVIAHTPASCQSSRHRLGRSVTVAACMARHQANQVRMREQPVSCLLYTSDAADE